LRRTAATCAGEWQLSGFLPLTRDVLNGVESCPTPQGWEGDWRLLVGGGLNRTFNHLSPEFCKVYASEIALHENGA
jgi:hypothetical protein